MNNSVSQSQSRGRKILLAMFAVTIAPVAASYLTYYFWKPTGGLSYGQLLTTQPVPLFQLSTLDNKAAALSDFKGKWLLVMADNAACAKPCQDALFAMRQFRVAQGKDMGRVERLWLLTGDGNPSAEALASADNAKIYRAKVAIPLPGDVGEGFYLIDPLGNQVIRYSRHADPVKVIKELGKFLKNNENLG